MTATEQAETSTRLASASLRAAFAKNVVKRSRPAIPVRPGQGVRGAVPRPATHRADERGGGGVGPVALMAKAGLAIRKQPGSTYTWRARSSAKRWRHWSADCSERDVRDCRRTAKPILR
jgi:hypothetical protein